VHTIDNDDKSLVAVQNISPFSLGGPTGGDDVYCWDSSSCFLHCPSTSVILFRSNYLFLFILSTHETCVWKSCREGLASCCRTIFHFSPVCTNTLNVVRFIVIFSPNIFDRVDDVFIEFSRATLIIRRLINWGNSCLSSETVS